LNTIGLNTILFFPNAFPFIQFPWLAFAKKLELAVLLIALLFILPTIFQFLPFRL